MVRQLDDHREGRNVHRSRQGESVGQRESRLDSRFFIGECFIVWRASAREQTDGSLLQIAELSHSVSSPMSFRVEYKRGGTAPAMFQRQVRFQVDISAISKQQNEPLFAITFTLLSGKFIRRQLISRSIESSKRPISRAPFSRVPTEAEVGDRA